MEHMDSAISFDLDSKRNLFFKRAAFVQPFLLPKFEIMARESGKKLEELSKDEFHACLRLRLMCL